MDPLPVEASTGNPTAYRYVNPVVRRLIASPLGRRLPLAVLEVIGRRSGTRVRVPVAVHDVDGQLVVLSSGRWRLNFRGGHPLELTWRGRRRRGHGELVQDRDEVVRVHAVLLDRVGFGRARQLGLKVNEARRPTADELRAGLAGRDLVRLRLE